MRYIGQSVKRLDGVKKVTGQAQFVDDLSIKANVVKVVRSTCAHGIIKKLDVSKAEQFPGVIKIVTGKDVPNKIGFCITDQYPIAVDRVRYFGEPLACIVAVDEDVAKEAQELLEIEYDELEPLMDPERAYLEEKNLIHPELEGYQHLVGFNPLPGTNVFNHFKIRRGDVEQAFAEADLVIENKFTIPLVQHAAIEPHGALGIYIPSEELVMYTSSQAPFLVRQSLSRLLGLPVSKVKVKVPYLGGGFGGKSDVTIEPLLGVVLANVPGKWCKLVLDRDEVFVGTVIGRGCTVYYKTGIKKDGTILGAEIKLYWNGGGYGDYAINITIGGGVVATGPYEIPNLKVDSYGVYTNTPPVGAYRGYGHPEAHWACERQIEIIACQLGLSPLDIRLKNCLRPGRVNAIGQDIRGNNGDLESCIIKAAELIGLNGDKPREPEKIVGRGIAALGKFPVMTTNAQSGAMIKVNEDGSVLLSIGAIEMGQGLHTAMAQILASTLNIPIEKIKVIDNVDTDVSPLEWQTVASHSTWAVGNAVIGAAQDLIAKLEKSAAQIFQVELSQIKYDKGYVYIKGKNLEFKMEDITKGYVDEAGRAKNVPIIGVGSFVPHGLTYLDSQTGQGNLAADWTYGCQAAEIEISLKSWEITVKKLVTVLDAGKIINKRNAEEQIKGAMVQSLGALLTEKLQFSGQGIMRNNDLTDYKIPTAFDIPRSMEVHFIETPEETGPYGARGLGEHGAVSVAPAVANAIYDAIKLNMYDLLLEKDAIYEYLAKNQIMSSSGGMLP